MNNRDNSADNLSNQEDFSNSSFTDESKRSDATHISQYLSQILQNPFQSIPKSSTDQNLHICLKPSTSIYIMGKILYSNMDVIQPRVVRNAQKSLVYLFKKTFIKGFNQQLMKQVMNKSNQIGYIGLHRKNGGGKLLILNSNIYGQNIFVDSNRILATNIGQENGIFKKHKILPNLTNRLLKEEDSNSQSINILQTDKGCTIIEKYLGVGEKLYVLKSLIVMLSGQLTVNINAKNRQWVIIQGVGWVFMQSQQEIKSIQTGFFDFMKQFFKWMAIIIILSLICKQI